MAPKRKVAATATSSTSNKDSTSAFSDMVQEPPVKRPSTRSSKALATADPSTSTSATASTSPGASSSKGTPAAATKAKAKIAAATTTCTATKVMTLSASKVEAKPKTAEIEPVASTTSSKTKTATTLSKKVVSKTKPIERVGLDDSWSDDTSNIGDSSVVIEAHAPKVTKSTGKKATEPIKNSTKAVKAAIASTSKSASKIATTKSTSKKVSAQSTEDIQMDTTSTPSPASAKKPSRTAKSAKVTAIPLTWDEQCRTWFAEYASQDDPELINFDGIQKLFQHMDISLADVTALVLSWKLKAPTFGSYSLADWQRTFRRDSVKSTYELKKWLLDVEKTLWPEKPSERSDARLHEFYLFLFSYMMPESQKTLPGDVALTIWDLVLARRFEMGRAIVRYGQSFAEGTLRGVSKDLYHQVWEFSKTVTPDLKGWSEDDACEWTDSNVKVLRRLIVGVFVLGPSTIDLFVEWQQKQLKGE